MNIKKFVAIPTYTFYSIQNNLNASDHNRWFSVQEKQFYLQKLQVTFKTENKSYCVNLVPSCKKTVWKKREKKIVCKNARQSAACSTTLNVTKNTSHQSTTECWC